ncbi:unnamed protein product [Urochloa humidicola]
MARIRRRQHPSPPLQAPLPHAPPTQARRGRSEVPEKFIPAKAFMACKVCCANEENGLLYVPKDDAQKAQLAMF